MQPNKYGGYADCNVDARVYALWFQMLRRCYDAEQQKRRRGRAYAGCIVCPEWHNLSAFAEDIKRLEGYDRWENNEKMVLDKDSVSAGNRIYSPDKCRFLSSSDSLREMNGRHPDITKNAAESHKVRYRIEMEFDSEREAADFLGVRHCSVASCYRRGAKCKGFTVTRIGARMDGEEKHGAEEG